jgi:hypothetical protein
VEGQHVRISFIQAGGFAGVSRGVELDTSTLAEAEARQITQLVENLEKATPVAGGDAAGGPRPDAASYRIRVEEGGRAREHTLRDGSMSEPAAELVRFLSSRAKPRRL